MYTSRNSGHSAKASARIELTLLPIVILVKFLQPSKAYLPMVATLLGIINEEIPTQLWNAELPIDVTLSGIFNEVILKQLLKALAGIASKLSLRTNDV